MGTMLKWIGFIIALLVFPFITIPVLLIYLLIKTGKATMKILLFTLLFLIGGSLLYAAFSNIPVLTIIVALIGLSVYLVIRLKKSKKKNLEG